MFSSDPGGSDFSEFALWEAAYPSQLREESEWERSLADMMRQERMEIWGDRDSSNDARSSGEEDEVANDGGMETREDVEILSSDVDSGNEELDVEDDLPPSSQPRPDEYENVIEISSENESDNDEDGEGEDEFASFDIKPEEKDFLRELLDVAPPEEVKKLTGKNRRSSDLFSDIMPDSKTTKNVGNFAKDHPFRKQKAWTIVERQEYIDDVYEFATAAGMSEFHANLEVQKAAGAWKLEKGLPLDNDRDQEAKLKERVENLDSAVEFNRQSLVIAKEQLQEASHGKQKKRKRDALGEGSNSYKPARESQQSAQPKDARSIEMKPDNRDLSREAKRREKMEKKARRRARRRAEEMALSVSSEATFQVPESHHPKDFESSVSQKKRSSAVLDSKRETSQLTVEGARPVKEQNSQALKFELQSSQFFYGEDDLAFPPLKSFTRNDISLSSVDEKSVGLSLKKKRREKREKKKPKKKSNLGPKTSEYFGKSKLSGLPFSTIRKDDITPPTETQHGKGSKPKHSSGEEMNQVLVADKLPAKAAKAGHGGHPSQIQTSIEGARRAMKDSPVLVEEVAREGNSPNASSKRSADSEVVQKKMKNRKHKRHRNKNRLAEPSSGNEESGDFAVPDEDETGDLPLKKNRHNQLENSDLDSKIHKAQDQDLAAPEEPTMEHENSCNISIKRPVARSDGNDRGDRPNKRRDRGRKRKSKRELETPRVSDFTAAQSAAESAPAFSDVPLESIEPNEFFSKRKRKRIKSETKKGKIESRGVGESADNEPLTELADTNSKDSKEGKRGYARKKGPTIDTMDLYTRPSSQSPKVCHSQ